MKTTLIPLWLTILIVGWLTAATSCIACADKELSSHSGKVATKTIDVASFNHIHSEMSIQVNYSQGPLRPLEISAPGDVIDKIRVTSKDNELSIAYNTKHFFSLGRHKMPTVIVTVQSPALTGIDVSSDAQLNVNGQLTLQSELKIDASSGAYVRIDSIKASSVVADISSGALIAIGGIDAYAVSIDASSGSEASFSGRCNTIDASASSGAIISAAALIAQRGNAESSAGATINVNVRNLNADTSYSTGTVNNIAP